MNFLHLGHRLGALSSPILQRAYHEQALSSLQHDERTTFSLARLAGDVPAAANVAHPNGVNCLALRSDILATGGADACIRLWNLAAPNSTANTATYHPVATLTRTPTAHTNAITSISIYPFDPEPSTLLSTSYDSNLLLTSITPTSLVPAHTFSLQHAIYCHAVSPIPTHAPLIAAGTESPAIRLLDLRSGLATHALPGHNGTIYTLAWSPKTSHILCSGATDGRVLFFDIRRANAAFASLDHDDAVGVSATHQHRLGGSSGNLLNLNAQAHTGPVTSVQWTTTYPHDRIVTTGHDQRIRIWDAASGRNELVHFGPRLKNNRRGTFGPLFAPSGAYSRKPTQEVLLWANDDARGEISLFGLTEGDLRGTMQVGGVQKSRISNRERGQADTSGGLLNGRGRGRVNAMVWREAPWEGGTAGGDGLLEMLSAHADGTVGVWRVPVEEDGDDDGGDRERLQGKAGVAGAVEASGSGSGSGSGAKKRKRPDLTALVEGLSKIRRPD